MSETTSEPYNSADFPPCERPAVDEPTPDLSCLCERIVRWSATFGTMNNRVTWAEANGMSDVVLEAAEQEEWTVFLEIGELAVTITEMHAVNQAEIQAKQRALNALTDNESWERDSLYALRLSIERDQLEVNAALVASSQSAQTQRVSWLSRLNPATAEG
jgi:hypothetical protein